MTSRDRAFQLAEFYAALQRVVDITSQMANQARFELADLFNDLPIPLCIARLRRDLSERLQLGPDAPPQSYQADETVNRAAAMATRIIELNARKSC